MKIINVKGCSDYLPEEERIRIYINNILKETFKEFGYQPIETPILCYYDMLSGKYDEGNDILKEIYKLTDQGKRNLGLRYDLTVPFAKFISLNKNKITFPFKRYEISKVFRDGPIKLGRDREFTQCDVDVVGIKGQLVEAELLSLYVEAFNKLNIDINIKYNSRNILQGLIKLGGIEDNLISSVITIIDKMNKITKDEFKEELSKLGLSTNQIEFLLNSFKLSIKELIGRYQESNVSELKVGIEEIGKLNNYIEELNLDKYCTFDPTLARGQDYYTGNIFEVYEKNGKLTSSIGGGGRYDKMITNFIEDGNEYPAVGISFGLSSIYELLKSREDLINQNNIDLYIIPMNTNTESLKLANKLRHDGLNVIIEMNNKKVGKALTWASKKKIPYSLVLGSDEINSREIEIRDMNNSQNIKMNMDDINKIVETLKNR